MHEEPIVNKPSESSALPDGCIDFVVNTQGIYEKTAISRNSHSPLFLRAPLSACGNCLRLLDCGARPIWNIFTAPGHAKVISACIRGGPAFAIAHEYNAKPCVPNHTGNLPNGLAERVAVYRSDNLDGIRAFERWDLVVGNPPHFSDISALS